MRAFKKNIKLYLPFVSLFLIFCLLIFLFIKKNKPYNYLITEKPAELVDAREQLNKILAPIDKKPLSQRLEESLHKKKQYIRKLPQKYYNKKNLLKLLYADETNLETTISKISKSASKDISKYNFGDEPFWNLLIKPQNQKEYFSSVKELEVVTLYHFEKYINEKNYDQAKLMVGAYWGVNYLKAFEFLGYDKNGKMLLTTPEYYEAALAPKKKRVPASDSIYNLNSYISEADSKNFQQVNYVDKLESKELRKVFSSPEDIEVSKAINFLESIVRSASSFLPVISEPAEFYEDNLQTEKELFSTIRSNPQKYGFTVNEANEITNTTQIDFELFASLVARKRAAVAAVIGGGLSALYLILETLIESTLTYAMYFIISIGVEGSMVILQCLQGIKSLDIYKRYHAYMWQQKAQAEIGGKPFDVHLSERKAREFEDKILPKISFDDEFKIMQRRVWSKAILLGLGLRYFFKFPAEGGDNKAFRLLRLTPRFILWNIEKFAYFITKMGVQSVVIAPILIKVSQTIRTFLQIPITIQIQKLFQFGLTDKIVDYLIGKMAPESLKTDPLDASKQKHSKNGDDNARQSKEANDVKKDFKNPNRHLLEKVRRASKGVLRFASTGTVYIVNAAVAAVAMHWLTHSVIQAAAKEINAIHSTPGDDFQLALATEYQGETFQEASQKILYPLCSYLAIASESPRGFTQAEARINRQQGCLNLIQKLEGFEHKQDINTYFPEVFEDLTADFSVKETNDYINDDEVQNKIVKTIKKSTNYPTSYRNAWVGALRSIFPLTQVSTRFWKVKAFMLLKVGVRTTIFSALFGYGPITSLTLSPNEVPQYANQARLLYVIDFLGEQSVLKDHAPFDASTLNEKQKQQILRTHANEKTDLVDEYIAYFKLNKYLLQESASYFAHIKDGEIEGGWGNTIKGLIKSFEVTIDDTLYLIKSATQPSLRNKITEENFMMREISKYL